jgi:serine/threonine protein kinase
MSDASKKKDKKRSKSATAESAEPLDVGLPTNFKHKLHVDHELVWNWNDKEAANDFQLIEPPIGQGAFGTVYHAIYLPVNLEMAIKQLDIGLRTVVKDAYSDSKREIVILDDGPVGRAKREEISGEIQILKQLSHPSCVRYFGCLWKNPGQLWIMMEFCHLGSIKQVMKDLQIQQLSEKQIALVMYYALQGLVYLHTHSPPLAHFDIKAGNLLLTKTGEVKVRLRYLIPFDRI